MNRKKGELLVVVVIVTALVLILCLVAVSMQYFQINNMLTDLKYNLFYICQNAILAYGDELNLDVYKIDSQTLKSTICDLLVKNYIETRKDISYITVEELQLFVNKDDCINHTKGQYEEPYVHIVVNVGFIPVIKIGDVDKKKVTIHQDVKLSLMKY